MGNQQQNNTSKPEAARIYCSVATVTFLFSGLTALARVLYLFIFIGCVSAADASNYIVSLVAEFTASVRQSFDLRYLPQRVVPTLGFPEGINSTNSISSAGGAR